MGLLDVYMSILYVLTAAFVGWILYAAYTECTGAGPAAVVPDDEKEFRMSELGSPSPTSREFDIMENAKASDTPPFSPTFKD